MPPPQQQAGRNNLQELKAKLSKILGPDKESQYFSIFSKFLSHRLSKSELDKQVVLTIGKENIALHNQIVKAILYNAACSEAPPPVSTISTTISTTTTTTTNKPIKGISRKPLRPSGNHDEASLLPHHPGTRSNGDGVRKGRSGVRKAKQNQNSLGLQQQQVVVQAQNQQQQMQQMQHFVKEEASTSQGDFEDLNQQQQQQRGEIDLLRPVQRIQGEQPDADSRVLLALKRPRLVLPCQQQQLDDAKARNSPESEDQDCTLSQASPIRAPLGIPLCVASIGSARRTGSFSRKATGATFLQGDSLDEEFLEATDLPDNDGMHRLMEEIAVVDGLQGVSTDCGHLLNQALDVYLKRLITASVGLAQSRRKRDEPPPPPPPLQQQQHQQGGLDLLLKDGVLSTGSAGVKLPHANGVWLNHHHLQQQQQQQLQQQQLQTDEKQRQQQACGVSVMDFKVAMDANPQLLGENRPLHMERIMLRVFEQQDGPVLQ